MFVNRDNVRVAPRLQSRYQILTYKPGCPGQDNFWMCCDQWPTPISSQKESAYLLPDLTERSNRTNSSPVFPGCMSKLLLSKVRSATLFVSKDIDRKHLSLLASPAC